VKNFIQVGKSLIDLDLLTDEDRKFVSFEFQKAFQDKKEIIRGSDTTGEYLILGNRRFYTQNWS